MLLAVFVFIIVMHVLNKSCYTFDIVFFSVLVVFIVSILDGFLEKGFCLRGGGGSIENLETSNGVIIIYSMHIIMLSLLYVYSYIYIIQFLQSYNFHN